MDQFSPFNPPKKPRLQGLGNTFDSSRDLEVQRKSGVGHKIQVFVLPHWKYGFIGIWRSVFGISEFSFRPMDWIQTVRALLGRYQSGSGNSCLSCLGVRLCNQDFGCWALAGGTGHIPSSLPTISHRRDFHMRSQANSWPFLKPATPSCVYDPACSVQQPH